MGRRTLYYVKAWDVPRTVVNIVKSVCADYTRRKAEIERGTLPKEVLELYAVMNEVVDRAVDEIEVGIRDELLKDIAHGRGYDVCAASQIMSKNAYYRRKRKVVRDIAAGLRLI